MSGPGAPGRRHVVQVLGDFGLGGDGRVVRDLALALGEAGVRTTCVALRSRPGAVPEAGPLRVVHFPADRGAVSTARALRTFRRFVRDEAPDVIHAHGPQSLVFVSAALVGLPRRPQTWFTWHDSSAVLGMGAFRDRCVRWAMRRCAHVYGSSRSVAERLSRELPPGRPAEVFRNGVADLPATGGMDDAAPLVVWAARFVPPKDPLALIRALAALRGEGLAFRAVLAGSAPPHLAWFEKQVRDEVASGGLADAVELPGWTSDVTAYCARGAIGVQTSHTEGLSMALLEQMMSGMAVVATDVGDTSVAVTDGVTGLLVPPRDGDALVRALRRLLADPALRKRLGAAARERALADFSLRSMARQVTRAI